MKFKKIFLLLMIIWAFALSANSQGLSFFTHEVQPGETLYGISVKYGVTVDLLKLQNNIATDEVMVGQKLRILRSDAPADNTQEEKRPNCRLMYEVQKKETVYSICKKFEISEEELYAANPILREKKLKKRQLLCIPYKVEVQPVEEPVEEIVFEQETEPMNVALILPFALGEEEVGAVNLKMLDFYEGFLMALETAKSEGLSADVYVYDESKIDSLGIMSHFSNGELANIDLIVGPYDTKHIDPLVRYASDNGIKVLVPFTSKNNYAQYRSNVFQLNVIQSVFYSKVYELFLNDNSDNNLIFLLANDRSDNILYYEGFKRAAQERGVNYKIVGMNSLGDLNDAMSHDTKNVIIPMSPSEKTFNRLVNSFDNVVNVDSVQVSMFGQPNWQQMVDEHKDEFVKYDCTFFTKFLYDLSDTRLVQFQSDFKRLFGREQYMSYPMYGVMGYDLGTYFLGAWNEYGADFAEKLSDYAVETLQTPLLFEGGRYGSGYANNKVMFVRVKGDGELSKRVY